jgi:hypothetical protein
MPWMVPWWHVATWALSWQWRRCPTGEALWVWVSVCVGGRPGVRGGGALLVIPCALGVGLDGVRDASLMRPWGRLGVHVGAKLVQGGGWSVPGSAGAQPGWSGVFSRW